ncbi:hypothetical protein [Archangium gephyra]|uniref:hypothetical protein n=1 Tax=Archangium gephyra TaxID=48 RepID=UPI0011C0CE9F|nr:hypothetical protein [Archangium gephyra]
MAGYEKITSVVGGRGSDRLPDSDFTYFIARGDPSGAFGQIGEWSINSYELVSRGVTKLTSSGVDLDGGGAGGIADIVWDGTEVSSGGLSGLVRIPSMDAEPGSLPELAFDYDAHFPEMGDSTRGNFYAAVTSSDNFSKLRIYKNAADGEVKVEWFTYRFTFTPKGFGFQDPRDIVLAVENGVTVAYVSAVRSVRSGTSFKLVGTVHRVPRNDVPGSRDFKTLSPSPYVVANWDPSSEPAGRNNPQQLALHDGRLYVANGDVIVRVDPVTVTKLPVCVGLKGATGLLLSKDGSQAYVTDTEKGGRLLSLKLNPSTGMYSVEKELVTGIGRTGFLEWADDERTSFYLPLPDGNEVRRIGDLGAPAGITSQTLLSASTGGPNKPYSVSVLSNHRLLIVSDSELGNLSMEISVAPGVLVMGIGLVPFTFINQDSGSPNAGRADTSGTSYFFQVNNVPFGGWLNLMINHEGAYELGARYYQVRFLQDGVPVSVSNGFTDAKWNATTARWEMVSTSHVALGSLAELYPVRSPTELWYNPYFGAEMNSTLLKNGVRTLVVTFFDAGGNPIPGASFERILRIDNNRSSLSLSLPVIGGRDQALTCGALQYKLKTDEFLLDYKVSHPTGDAIYSLSIYGGGRWLPAPISESGRVGDAAPPKVKTVYDIIGDCNVANVYIRLGTEVRVTNGYWWIYGNATDLSFTLVPDSVPLH